MSEKNILFLCAKNSLRSQMAEGFARKYASSEFNIFSAGMVKTGLNPDAVSVMKELGIDIASHRSKTINELGRRRFHLVIILCDNTTSNCPVFPGAPAIVHWPVKDPIGPSEKEEKKRETLRKAAFEIKGLVEGLFTRGYISAFMKQKENMDSIMDCLSEGVLAHDTNRRIFLFSRGAEKLTGYKESEVLGMDCSEVFRPRLCGENCAFCDGCRIEDVKQREYSTVFIDSKSVRKEFNVKTVPLKDDNNQLTGVVVSFQDNTAVANLKRQKEGENEFRGMIGRSHKMREIFETIREVAQYDFPVVITGESGTGKELAALALHFESPRKDEPFVPVNCGALPEGTLESELFGHVKGAFTGAIRDKKGRFELADGGTLFLDEVAELPLKIQVKLLRVLQDGKFEPVGSEKTKKVNIRIISATNKNLKDMVNKGSFREDLYYRLSVIPVELPALRQKKDDIPLITRYFLKKMSDEMEKKDVKISDDSLEVFMSYSWPGNVRQLQSAVQFAIIKSRGGRILPQHLPQWIREEVSVNSVKLKSGGSRAGRKPKLTREKVESAMQRTDGNKAKAARILGVGRATLYNFLSDSDINLNIDT